MICNMTEHISIDTPLGVSHHGFDTYLVTRYLSSLTPRTLLDVGTGSGYIAITAAKNGWRCTASDISSVACSVAQKNAHAQHVSIPIIHSDLFSAVEGQFDYVVFNPPYGSSSEKGSALLEKIKSYIIDLVFASREPENYKLKELVPLLLYGVSPRATLALHHASKAHAFLKHRHFVIPDDVKAVAPAILRHRFSLSYEAEAEDLSADTIIQKILSTIPSP